MKIELMCLCLLQSTGPDGLVLERVGGLDHDIGRTGNQVVCLEQPVDRSLRDKIAFCVDKVRRQLSR